MTRSCKLQLHGLNTTYNAGVVVSKAESASSRSIVQLIVQVFRLRIRTSDRYRSFIYYPVALSYWVFASIWRKWTFKDSIEPGEMLELGSISSRVPDKRKTWRITMDKH